MLTSFKAAGALLLFTSLLAFGAPGGVMGEPARQEKPQPFSLFECVTAGDYRWIEISTEGKAEALRAGRGLRVFEYRRGRLSDADVLSLQRLWITAGLEKLPGFLSFEPEEGIVTEDLYFFVSGGGAPRSLVAHEAALPRQTAPLVQALQDVARRLPEASSGPARMIALPAEMLICLGEDAPRVDIGNTGTSRTYLERVLRAVGQSVAIAPADIETLEKRLFRGTSLVRVRDRKGRDHAVLVFRQEAPH